MVDKAEEEIKVSSNGNNWKYYPKTLELPPIMLDTVSLERTLKKRVLKQTSISDINEKPEK